MSNLVNHHFFPPPSVRSLTTSAVHLIHVVSPLKLGSLSGEGIQSPDESRASSRFAKGDGKFVSYMRR